MMEGTSEGTDRTATLEAENKELRGMLDSIKPALRYFPSKLEEVESLLNKER